MAERTVLGPRRIVDGLYAAAAGQVVFGSGDLQISIVTERPGRLHEPLTEGSAADEHRPVHVLQRTGHDFGGRRRTVIDEHHERYLRIERVLLRGKHRILLRIAPPEADYLGSARHEEGEYLDRLLHDTASVVPIVEYKGFGPLLPERHDGVAHVVAHFVRKIDIENIPHAVGQHAIVGNAGNIDYLPFQLHLHRIAGIEFGHLHLQSGARFSLHQRTHLFGRHGGSVLSVYFENPVAHDDTGPIGRRAFVGLRENHSVAALADKRTHAAVTARGEELEGIHILLGDKDGIWVESGRHAGGRIREELVGVHVVHIEKGDVAQHIDQHLHVAPHPEPVGRRNGRRSHCQHDGTGQYAQPVFNPFSHNSCSVCMCLS